MFQLSPFVRTLGPYVLVASVAAATATLGGASDAAAGDGVVGVQTAPTHTIPPPIPTPLPTLPGPSAPPNPPPTPRADL